jgi:hypothetical protein
MALAIGSETTRQTKVLAPARAGLAALIAAAVVVFAAPAFAASGPPAGTKVPGATVPIGNYSAGAPFSSGQVIEVKIPPNSTLTPGAGIRIVECAAPHGQVPTQPSQCDGETIQGNTVLVNPDGSVDYKRSATSSGYTVYAVPNAYSLGEPPDSVPVCNKTHLCVLYIGQNQLDFTAPHFWSEPFSVNPTPKDTGAGPGDGTAAGTSASGGGSNALLTIALPAVVVVAGGAILVLRRRRVRSDRSAQVDQPTLSSTSGRR